MKTGLEEALAECLASLERGRSVEECLARYPGLAQELEPLLRTALGLQQAYDVGPRLAFQRAARQRFLAAAVRLRRSRRPLAVVPPPRRFSFGWRWAPAALGTAALVAAIALATVLALAGGGGTPEGGITVRQISPTATETPPEAGPEEIDQLVARAQERIGEIQARVEQGEVIPREAIRELKDINESLEQSLREAPPEAAEAAPQIVGLLEQQQAVLFGAREQNQVAPEAADDVDEVIRIAGTVRDLLSPTATPAASPTPALTPAPTGTPASSPTATATQEASATVTPTPTSSLTPGSAGGEIAVPLTPTPGP